MADSHRVGLGERDIDQAITALKKGSYLLKYGRRGKPKFCPFQLSSDESALIWYSGKDEKSIKLNQVTKIIPGQRTAIFQRYPRPEKEYQSFSLIYGDRSLDLICKDKDEADVWFVGLKALITHGNYNRKWRIDTRSESTPSESPYSHTRRNSPSITPFDLEPAEGQDQSLLDLEGNPPNRIIGKAFSDIVSYTVSINNRPNSAAECSISTVSDTNPSGRSSTTEPFRVSLSSALSSSSQGSCHDDFDALGDVFIWGEGSADGALGGGGIGNQSTGSKSDALLPKALESTVVLDVYRIACGGNHAALVTRQGEIFTWGEGLGGRLGHGKDVNAPYPKLVHSMSGMNVDVVACGVYHTCAVTMSGDLYTWGDGGGSEVSHWIPKRVTHNIEGIHVSNVSCGPWHTAAVTSNGQLFTFGDGTLGTLGHGDRASTIVPREVESLRGLRTKRVACGLWHTAAVAVEEVSDPVNPEAVISFGKLYTWGSGDDGCLGHGDEESKLVPQQVIALVDENVSQIGCGHNFTVVLTASGRVYTMGSDAYGQLGCPKLEDAKVPHLVKGKLSDCTVEDVTCGAYHVAALTSKSEVYTWGRGSNGQLGHGDKESRNTPKLVDFLRSKQVKTVVCGSNFTAIVCLHKWVGSGDHSLCTGCRNQFGFRRKRHNCYNCGLVFCKACSARKSLKASLAPSTNKPYRVCDDCFHKLKKVLDSMVSLPKLVPQGRTLSCSPIRSMDFADREIILPRLLSQYSRVSTPDTIRDPWQSKRHNNTKGGQGMHNNLVFPTVTGNLQSVRFGTLLKVPTVTQVSLRKPSPRHSPSSSIGLRSSGSLDDTRSMNGASSSVEEIHSLRARLEDLTWRNKRLESELERKSKQLKQVKSLAADEAEKCKSAKEVIKSLTCQLKDMAERSPHAEQASSSRSSHELPPGASELSQEIEPNGNSADNHIHMLTYGPKNQSEKLQHVVQAEPGVFITLSSLPTGGNELKRVRFSRKYFLEDEAERWWEEKGTKFCERYNIDTD